MLTGEQDPNLAALVGKLVADQAVPYLAALRYTDSGLRKRAEWEQRVGAAASGGRGGEGRTIPVPPKYKQQGLPQDLVLAGARQVGRAQGAVHLLPGRGAVRGRDSLVIGWAGWDHAEQARALARLIVERRQRRGLGRGPGDPAAGRAGGVGAVVVPVARRAGARVPGEPGAGDPRPAGPAAGRVRVDEVGCGAVAAPGTGEGAEEGECLRWSATRCCVRSSTSRRWWRPRTSCCSCTPGWTTPPRRSTTTWPRSRWPSRSTWRWGT